MSSCTYLPSIIELHDYENSWEQYLKAVYLRYLDDIANGPLLFHEKIVFRNDVVDPYGIENTFWHIISEGKNEKERTPDLRRCERVSWIKVLLTGICTIAEGRNCENYKIWAKVHEKTNKNRWYVWCSAEDYVIVLEERNKYYFLITAFVVKYPDKRNQFEREYQTWIKTKTPIS